MNGASTRPWCPVRRWKRENLISWSKDIGRAIDYLKTRTDIDANKIAYLGVSQGAAYGVILVALEQRFKTAVFLDGGMFQFIPGSRRSRSGGLRTTTHTAGCDGNGRYDTTFPYQTSQQPLFHLLRHAAGKQASVEFDTPHDVRLRRTDLVKEVLQWLTSTWGVCSRNWPGAVMGVRPKGRF